MVYIGNPLSLEHTGLLLSLLLTHPGSWLAAEFFPDDDFDSTIDGFCSVVGPIEELLQKLFVEGNVVRTLCLGRREVCSDLILLFLFLKINVGREQVVLLDHTVAFHRADLVLLGFRWRNEGE